MKKYKAISVGHPLKAERQEVKVDQRLTDMEQMRRAAKVYKFLSIKSLSTNWTKRTGKLGKKKKKKLLHAGSETK